MDIPDEHPRKTSLDTRHKLIDGFKQGIVAEAGLIAHGRGEAMDYLLGEETSTQAFDAIEAGVSLLLLAENPVISINGNVASLVRQDIIELANLTNALMEVNLFYFSFERVQKIVDYFSEVTSKKVFGLNRVNQVEDLKSERGLVDDALWNADVVLVMLEDGDRTEMIRKVSKKVVCIDLNPMSRSAKMADITIVDNVVRCLPLMIQAVKKLSDKSNSDLEGIVSSFNQEENLKIMESKIRGI